jgi:G:T/U-mismatch repair DNA glycosylase
MTKPSQREFHPYGNFVPPQPRHIIVGSFPIAKFTNPALKSKIKAKEIDFSYGGEKSHLWNLLGLALNESLSSKTEITAFLERKGIAIGDVVASCKRRNGYSSDTDLREIVFNHELKSIIEREDIRQILFTSTRVRQWFNSKIGCQNTVEQTLLISPSGSGMRALNRMHQKQYESWRIRHPDGSLPDFRLSFYKKIFTKKAFPNKFEGPVNEGTV